MLEAELTEESGYDRYENRWAWIGQQSERILYSKKFAPPEEM